VGIVRVYVVACRAWVRHGVNSRARVFARLHNTHTHIHIYICGQRADIHVSRRNRIALVVLQHYATVTRRGKFTRISLVRARRKFICRVYTCIPIVNCVMHPRARAASLRFHGDDDRVKLARALHSERTLHSPGIYLSRCAPVVRIVAY